MAKFIETYFKFEQRWWFLFFPLYFTMLNVGFVYFNYLPTHVVVKILCVVFLLFCAARVIVLMVANLTSILYFLIVVPILTWILSQI